MQKQKPPALSNRALFLTAMITLKYQFESKAAVRCFSSNESLHRLFYKKEYKHLQPKSYIEKDKYLFTVEIYDKSTAERIQTELDELCEQLSLPYMSDIIEN